MRPGADFTLASGPTTISPRALAALAHPVVSHYDPDFVDLYRRAEADLARLFCTGHDVLMMAGEAVLGLEAAVAGLARPGGHGLAVVSGMYGAFLADELRAHGMTVDEVRADFNDAVDVDRVEEALERHPDIELLTVVHCESASGTVNDAEQIGQVARRHDVTVIVDAVASLGGMPLRPDEWGLDICVAGPQKCLGGPVGLALVSVSPRAWARMEANPAAPRNSYLSLLDHRDKWIRNGRFTCAPPVSDVYAAAAVFEEVLEEGLEARYERHARAAAACRAGITGLGLELWASSEDVAAPAVTAATLPDRVTPAEVVAHVRQQYGVMLSDGAGVGNFVRIGHMGETSRSMYPVLGVVALGQALLDLNVDVDVGAGAAAATAALAGPRRRGGPR